MPSTSASTRAMAGAPLFPLGRPYRAWSSSATASRELRRTPPFMRRSRRRLSAALRDKHQRSEATELRLAASWELRLGRARRHGDLLLEALPLSLLDRNDVPPERT